MLMPSPAGRRRPHPNHAGVAEQHERQQARPHRREFVGTQRDVSEQPNAKPGDSPPGQTDAERSQAKNASQENAWDALQAGKVGRRVLRPHHVAEPKRMLMIRLAMAQSLPFTMRR